MSMIKKMNGNSIKNSFSKSIIELKLMANRIAEGKGIGAGVFTVKYQILYLVSSNEKVSPQELIFELNMAKSNLALITKKMVQEGLLISTKEPDNKKQIYYVITEKGKEALKEKMKVIDNSFSVENKEVLQILMKTVELLKNVK